ncbi:MAG: DUF401 family protein [candidate division Zixibacteria bacterium]
MTVLKLLLVLAVIIYGIKRKFFVGYLLCGVGIALPFLFGYGPTDVLKTLYGTASSFDFWRLFAAIAIVTFLGNLLKTTGSFDRLTDAAQHLAGGKRTATAILPASIGMMPMPAGALLSAPLVKEVLKDDNLKPEFLSATNYWYRHVMEFFWPLYPGIILGAGLCGISQQIFSALGIINTLFMITIGIFLFLLKIPNNCNHSTRNIKSIFRIAYSIWPLFLAVILTMALEIDIVLSLLSATILTMIINRPSWAKIIEMLKKALTFRLFFMVFGILVFKDMLELSGAVADMPAEVARFGIHPAFIIFSVTFLAGLMSGMVALYVGLCFPILSGFLYDPVINLNNIYLTYLSGYLGIILSPTHFCLLLTSEYFKADLGRVYRKFVPGIILLAMFGFLLYWLGYPWDLLAE